MKRYETVLDGDRVYVESGRDRVLVGDREAVIEAVGGHAWTIEYGDWHREHYPDLDTSDEGLTVDVVDVMAAMTHSERFVDTLRSHPADPPGDDELSPRLGLFVGKLLENLETGVE